MECKTCPFWLTDIDCTVCHVSDYRYLTTGGAEWFCKESGEVFEPRYRQETTNEKKVFW